MNTIVELKAATGQSLTLKLFAYGSDVLANSGGDTLTEATNCKGRYTATVTEALDGLYDAIAVDGSGNLAAAYSVEMADDTDIHRCFDPANSDGAGSLSSGAGADEVTLTINNTTTSLPVPDADVWVTSDAGGDSVVAGTLQTDSQGEVTFLLDAGNTYYLWMQKDGVEPIRGQSFVAVAD